MAADDGSMKI